MKLKFFRRKAAELTTKPADEPADIATATATQVRRELHPIVDGLHLQLRETGSMVKATRAFVRNYQWDSIAKDINERLDTGILGAIKLWVDEATIRGRHDRKLLDELLKRWENDHAGLLRQIEDQKKTIATLETQIRSHLESM